MLCMDKQKVKFVLDLIVKDIEDLGIKWWLEYGTALGFYRDHDFIDYDDDIDIGILVNDKIDLLVQKLRKNFTSFREFSVLIEGYKYRYLKINLYSKFDILIYYSSPRIGNYFSIRKIEKDSILTKQIPKYFIDKLEEIDYKGKPYKIPGFTEEYLEYVYGERWKEPRPQDKNMIQLEKIKIKEL